MAKLHEIYIFRMTHIHNVRHIVEFGITHKDSFNANPKFIQIGDSSIISTRNNILLMNGNRIGEYVPFYFGVRMPMLMVIQKGYNGVESTLAEEIVYCVTSVKNIIDSQLDFVFTDGHANNYLSTQYVPENIDEVEKLVDFEATRQKYWKNEDDLDLKRRKEAEFLVKGDIPYNAVLGFIVYNQTAKNELLKLGIKDENVHIIPEYYF